MDRRRNPLHYPNMANGVPTYALYGEEGIGRPHDWLHWETIQARSRLYGYAIDPHRHEQFLQLLSLTGGSGHVTLDGAEFALVPPVVVLVPALTVHGYNFSADVEGVVVTLLEREMLDGADRLPPGVITHGTESVDAALAGLLREADRPGEKHDLAMRAHVMMLQVTLHRALSDATPMALAAPTLRHAAAFRDLIDERFRETRRLADYAGAIGISQTHLNRVCRQSFGASALSLIERRIALEARRQLLFSTLSVKQIGAGLGFDDPAYFTRFLKRLLGTAPTGVRRQRQR